MPTDAILLPVAAQCALTLLVALVLLVRRGADARAKKTSVDALPQTRALSGEFWSASAARASDNLANLFETPVLFFALALGLYVSGEAGTLAVGLAWAYVALRVVHSAIHLTYNKISQRFMMFLLSVLVLMAMTVLLALAALT